MLKAAVIAGLTLVSGVAMAQTAPPPPPPGVEPPPPPPPGPPARFYLAPGYYAWVNDSQAKVFCFFSSEKKSLLFPKR
jgi:hypothetical protein